MLGRLVCGRVLVMTALPGVLPSRRLRSSSARRGAGGSFSHPAGIIRSLDRATVTLIGAGRPCDGALRESLGKAAAQDSVDIIITPRPRFQTQRRRFTRSRRATDRGEADGGLGRKAGRRQGFAPPAA